MTVGQRLNPQAALPHCTAAPPVLPEQLISSDHDIYYRCGKQRLLLPVENQLTELQQATRRQDLPFEASLECPTVSVRVALHRKRSAVLTCVPRECRQPKPSKPMISYVRRLGNNDVVQERARMTHGPDGDDSTKEDEDATELATLRLLSKC